MKKFILVLFIMVISLSAFFGCESESDLENEHEHEWGKWEIVQDATCLEAGLQERTCYCGKTKNKELPVLEHIYSNGICTACGTFEETYCQKLYDDLRSKMLTLENDDVFDSIKEELDKLPNNYKDVSEIKEEYLFISNQKKVLDDAIINYICKMFEPDEVNKYYIDYANARRAYLNLVNNDDKYDKWDLIGLANYILMGTTDDGNKNDFVFMVVVGEWTTSDGEYYFDFIEKESNDVSFRTNIPNQKNSEKDYYYYIEGKNIGYEEKDNENNSFNSYRIEEISEEYIKVFCYENSRIYTLYSNN